MGIPTSENLWKRHENLVLNVFIQALVKLQNENNLPEDEPGLNDLLYVHVRNVWCELPINEKPMWSLNPNSENPPRTKNEIGQEWTRKKPDFKWTLSDLQEEESVKAIREYTIECKRLKTKTKAGWNFINEYIVSGIIRFISIEHRYGMGTTSGAMIGYIQNMEHDEILEKINKKILDTKEYQIPVIKFPKHCQNTDSIERGKHTLHRGKIYPSDFDLCHIWVKLENCGRINSGGGRANQE